MARATCAGAWALLQSRLPSAKESPNLTLSPGIVILLMMVGAMLSGALVGAIPGLLKGRFNTNEIVVTMMLNSITFWLVAYMIKDGGPFMGGGGEGEGYKLPESIFAPQIFGAAHNLDRP
jgi:simple sugar transport system permease protein